MKRLLNMLRVVIINKLGGVTKGEYEEIFDELSNVSNELVDCKLFITSIYTYIGNYPAWKVQQEYHEMISSTHGFPIDADKLENIDRYLGRIVYAFKLLLDKRPQIVPGQRQHFDAELECNRLNA